MEKEFIPYEQALALKELGFDKPCFRWYDERWGDDLQQDKYNTNIINSLHSVPKIKRSNVILDPIRDRQNMITLYISCCLILAIGIVDIELDK